MRNFGFLACLVMGRVCAHPLCFFNDRPTDVDRQLEFCPPAQDGACCTEAEESAIQEKWNDIDFGENDECAELYKEVLCGVCHSYSAHLYEVLGASLQENGLTMKQSFCDDLVEACEFQGIPLIDEDPNYCDTHVGGRQDRFWSYPYTEAEMFEPGLNKVFPDLDNENDFPTATISMHQSPDGSMFWLMGQLGEIRKVDADKSRLSLETVVDISGGEFYHAYEEGLLDFAFGPMFGIEGYPLFFYLSYTCLKDDGKMQRNRLSRFEYFAGDPTKTRESETELITSAPKYNSIHAAGWCGFKPSAYGNDDVDLHELYWTTGDGGPQTDPLDASQDVTNHLGSMMRILVSSTMTDSKYKIPTGNLGDFVDTLPEICASGFRNPFRCGFDREDDKLVCGDVGHSLVEEIDIVECGKNYGWSRFEGSRCQEAMEGRDGPCRGASRSNFEFPMFEYCHPDYFCTTMEETDFVDGVDICGERLLTGNSVIGGYFYRGSYFADLLAGCYIFGDSTNKNVYFLEKDGDKWRTGTIISDRTVDVISFTEDINGEIMIITSDYNIYHMPCGDLCATTCLDQAEELPSYEPLGCYTDDKYDRTLTLAKSQLCDDGERAMSLEICVRYCARLPGATYFGVESGSQCFCGNDGDIFQNVDKPSLLSNDRCGMVCTGDPREFCGGWNAIQVYSFNVRIPQKSFSFSGCFLDNNYNRVLSSPFIESPTMTIETCAAECSGATYFGVEYGKQCFCSKGDDTLSELASATCDMPCSGDETQICGGNRAISVYTFSEANPGPAPSYDGYEALGCFVDPSANRVFKGGYHEDPEAMTVNYCATSCEGSAFFGVEYGKQCWCGNAQDVPDVHGSATSCNMPCSGDNDQICGGRNALNAYRYTAESVPTTGYVGCYKDSKDNRIMVTKSNIIDMTVELCAETCLESKYYGLQYGNECWCSAKIPIESMTISEDCTKPCPGDQTQICGGRYAVSVYDNTVAVLI